jgi:GtrA-like protein
LLAKIGAPIQIPTSRQFGWQDLPATFDDRAVGRPGFEGYGLIAPGAQSINYGVFIAMIEVWPAVSHTAAAIVGAVIAAGFCYAGHRFFTFRKLQTSREG